MNRNIMRQAQELQARLAKAQQELAEASVDGTAGGGVVTVTMDGQQRVKAVRISPDVVKAEDVEMLQDLIVAAINEVTRKSQELASSRLSAITGGLKIPGLT
ncbi:MAG: YbaB/EbfC family nucleoid-associated protein [Chloroflexota bacterium]